MGSETGKSLYIGGMIVRFIMIMRFILRLASAAWMAHLICNKYENIQFWVMYLITYFAILMLFDLIKVE